MDTATSKPLINLGLGDPTVFGLHPPPEVAITAMQDVLVSGAGNGYVAGTGDKPAREAVARYHNRWDRVQYDADDVTLVSFGLLLDPRQGKANQLMMRHCSGAWCISWP